MYDLNAYRAELIQFFKYFIHYSDYSSDYKYYLFHLHMDDHFKQEDQGLFAFDFCDWISHDLEESMEKMRNGVRYDPSYGVIVLYVLLIH